MRSYVADCVGANETPGILDTSVAEGYPYSDVEKMGMAWVAIADGDMALAKSVAKGMASRAWERRAELNVEVASISDALDMAIAEYVGPRDLGDADVVATDGTALSMPDEDAPAREGPIVLMDVGDNIGGGSSADSTHILAQVVERGISGFLQTLYDPESVDACVAAGVGGYGDAGCRRQDGRHARIASAGDGHGAVDHGWAVRGVGRVARRLPVLRLGGERAVGYGWWSDVGADIGAGR